MLKACLQPILAACQRSAEALVSDAPSRCALVSLASACKCLQSRLKSSRACPAMSRCSWCWRPACSPSWPPASVAQRPLSLRIPPGTGLLGCSYRIWY